MFIILMLCTLFGPSRMSCNLVMTLKGDTSPDVFIHAFYNIFLLRFFLPDSSSKHTRLTSFLEIIFSGN